MNFTSQICTTKEQSERLLDLGLKAETADMKYPCIAEYYGGVLTEGMSSLPMIITTEDDEVTEYDLPAWSLHRLIEMYHKTCIFWTDCGDNPYEAMVCRIADKIRRGEFNKEYLEE